MFLMLVVMIPASVMAQVQVRVNIPLPPPIFFPAPPAVVVIPESDVYVVPDVQEDIFFYGGWWWRPWEGRWYRSRYHDRGWAYYNSVPLFYRNVPRGWRNDYRDRRWRGHEWDHRPIPHHDVERNWKGWKKDKHWERENHWGVKGMERLPSGQQKKFHERNDGPPRGGVVGPQGGRELERRPPGQQKKFHERNDGPPREGAIGHQGEHGRGHQDEDRGGRR